MRTSFDGLGHALQVGTLAMRGGKLKVAQLDPVEVTATKPATNTETTAQSVYDAQVAALPAGVARGLHPGDSVVSVRGATLVRSFGR